MSRHKQNPIQNLYLMMGCDNQSPVPNLYPMMGSGITKLDHSQAQNETLHENVQEKHIKEASNTKKENPEAKDENMSKKEKKKKKNKKLCWLLRLFT